MAQLVTATARRSSGVSAVNVKKGKKKAPPKLEGVAKDRGLPKTEPNSAGFSLAPPAMVDMTLDSPGPNSRIISPRSAARYQPYPQSPPGQSLAPLRLKPDLRKAGGAGRQRSKTVGNSDATLARSVSRSRPQPVTRHPRAAQPTSLVEIGQSDDDSFSLSPKELRTPPGPGSVADWSSQDERSPERGRARQPIDNMGAQSRRRYSAPLSLLQSPALAPQPLGYGDDNDPYDMDDDGDVHDSGDGGSGDGGYPHAVTYPIPPLHNPLPSSSAGLTTPLLRESPVIPSSFPGYDRFATSLAYDRSRQHQPASTGYTSGPWEASSYSDAYYRPVAPSSSYYRVAAQPQPPTASQSSLPSGGIAHYAPFHSGQGGTGGGPSEPHPAYGSYDVADGLFYPAESPPHPSVASASFGHHAHPPALQYHPSQHAHHRRR
jgi:hypothetical protein